MTPFKVFVDGANYTASWFIDFALLPEFQRQGLGPILTKKWMEFSDFYMSAPCNENPWVCLKNSAVEINPEIHASEQKSGIFFIAYFSKISYQHGLFG
jgi:hypothetical protein